MNRSSIRELTRTLLSEPTSAYWSDTELNNYIDYGLTDFCQQTDCLEDISTDSLVQYQADYALPSDYTKIKRVELVKGNTMYALSPEDLAETFTGIVKTTQTPPEGYNIWEGNLRLRERPSAAAQSTTLGATITSSATSLTVASASGIPRAGRIIIGSEVISYWNLSGTTLSPCTRGAEGTTAAAHTSGDTLTLRDIWIYHFKKETLSSDSSTPSMQFHEAPAYYAAALGRRKSKDHDLADKYEQKYMSFVVKGIEWGKLKWKRPYKPK